MREKEFIEKLEKKIPDLVYNNSLLDSESIEIPVYFGVDENGDVKLDVEGMYEEFKAKVEEIEEIIKGSEK